MKELRNRSFHRKICNHKSSETWNGKWCCLTAQVTENKLIKASVYTHE